MVRTRPGRLCMPGSLFDSKLLSVVVECFYPFSWLKVITNKSSVRCNLIDSSIQVIS